MHNDKLNAFGKLGRLITKRKFSIIAVWLLLLAIILPVVMTATGYTAMTLTSSTDSSSESSKADSIISEQFQTAVSNDSLLLIVSTDNASSVETQHFLDELINKIKSDSRIAGVENVTSIYTVLVPALNQTNQGVYLAYDNGNLTYNLLYSVPTVYSKVWYVAYDTALNGTLVPGIKDANDAVYALISNANQTCNMLYSVPMIYSTVYSTAYNQTRDSILVPGLNQANQGVYELIPMANQTYNMLYSVPMVYSTVYATAYNQTRDTMLVPGLSDANQGVYTAIQNTNLTYNMLYSAPAIYLNVWSQTYTATSDIAQANFMANKTTAETLCAIDPVAYAQYTSHILEAFNSYWTASLSDPSTASWTPLYRASYASDQTNQLYIHTYLSGNQEAQAFTTAVINNFSLEDYLTNSPTQNTAKMASFAIHYVAEQADVSVEFVEAAYYLGVNPSRSALTSLAENVIQNPAAYGMDTDFISTFNMVAFNQTRDILQDADAEAYTEYTGPLLSAFNTTWTLSFQNPALQSCTVPQRACLVSNMTNQAFIDQAFASNATAKAFAKALLNNFTLNDYVTNTQAEDNAKLEAFALNYVAEQAEVPLEFVQAAYHLGSNSTTAQLVVLAEDVIQHPVAYNMGTDFLSTFNEVAFNQTQIILQDADAEAYTQYTGPLLSAFNTTWVLSFQNPALQSYTVPQRAYLASNMTNHAFINSAFASNATAKAFAEALTENFTFNDYTTNTQAENNAKLEAFALNYVADEGGISPVFVQAAYNLGSAPTDGSIAALANDVIWHPSTYGMDQDFIELFNSVAYNQTESILKDADEESFNKYTSHLLDYFNASWASKVPTRPAENWLNSTASAAADVANKQFINEYLSDNADFVNGVAQTFTLQDYLDGNTTYTNAKLCDFAVGYVADESGLSKDLVKAAYDLGGNASKAALQTLASNMVYAPDRYNVGAALDSAIDMFISPSNDVTIVSISLNQADTENVPKLRSLIAEYLNDHPDGVSSIKVTGTDAISYDFRESTNSDLDLILPVTIALLVVATALFFHSIVTPIITLGTIGVGLGVSFVFPYLVGTYINQIDYTIMTVLMTVLIGVGTDYSIFIIARHREERINGLPLFEAIKKSITWAGESIVTSGTTVIISFLSLWFTSMVFLQTMGLIIGLGVIVTLIGALTFAPALTAILGDRIFWPNSGDRFQKYADGILEKNRQKGGYFAKSGAFSVKHSKAIILVAIVLTVPALYVYASTVQTYNFLDSASDSLESISGYNCLTDSFGSGRMLPTYAVVTFSEPIVYGNGSFNTAELSKINEVSCYIANHDGIQDVTGPTEPYGSPVDYQTVTNASDPTTYSGMLSAIGADNKSALITVKFTEDPYSTEAMANAQDIRTNLHAAYDNTDDVTGIYVGGTTGLILDIKNTFSDELNQILPVVTICVALVLFFVLGSLILPIFAVLSVFMSIFWTLAVTILVFQSAFNYGLLFITPLILLVLLLGLGMDYNIFILTRVREEAAKRQGLKEAIVHAIQQTGGIITAAAVILAGSLGSLMLSSNIMLKELGFAFAFSILIDALVVRTYLVPAVMAAFGKWNWYNPIKRLRRVRDEDLKASAEETETRKQ